MICPRLRAKTILLGLCIAPAACWALVVCLMPTAWLADRLERHLEASTGRAVQLGSVGLGWLGDVRIRGLAIAEASRPADPWLRVGEARVGLNLWQVVAGRFQPSSVVVADASLRVWRRGDGRLEFADLLCPARSRPPNPRGEGADDSARVRFSMTGANLHVVDDLTGTDFSINGVSTSGGFGPGVVLVEAFAGRLNDGGFQMTGAIGRDEPYRFEGEVVARGVHLGRGLQSVAQFVPIIAQPDDSIGGRINLRLVVRGQGTSLVDLERSIGGHGSVSFDPIDLDGSKILNELEELGDCPRESRVASVSSTFSIENRRVVSEDVTIRASKFPLILGGWADFDGRYDYRVMAEKMAANLPRAAKSVMGEARAGLKELGGLRIKGAGDDLEITLNGLSVLGDPRQTNPERAKVREAARRIRDQIFR